MRSSILTVPVTFPPEEVPRDELLAVLRLPDIRGTMGTLYYFGTDLSRTDADRTKIAELETREDLRLPITIHWNQAGRSATVNLSDAAVHLQEGEWSKWIDLDFDANFFVRVHGMAQLYLIRAGQELQLYVSPVNWRPDKPPVPMSSPVSLAADLFEQLGHYRTLGWAEATWPLNEERIDEKAFMDDLFHAFEDRAQVIFHRLDTKQWDLLVGVIESTDRVQHMMWRLIDPLHPMYDKGLAARFGDSIERVYQKCDEFVGEVVSRLAPNTPLLIVSDHGFHSFRQAANLNTWLVQEGFMTLQGLAPSDKTLDDLFGGGTLLGERRLVAHQGLCDGPRLNLSRNLTGREAEGIVSLGVQSKGVQDEIAAAEGTMALVIHEGTSRSRTRLPDSASWSSSDHGSQTFSLYGNLLDIAVERGARADRGQPVGSVGSAPAGPAGLYFELRVDGQPVDPLQWLRKRKGNGTAVRKCAPSHLRTGRTVAVEVL